MRTYQELVAHVEGIFADAQRKTLSRRGLVSNAAKIGGGGALALAASGTRMGGLLRVSAADFNSDQEILDYALTLEHLEYAFYRDGLDNLNSRAFRRLGRDDVYGKFAQIRDHEGAHVDLLSGLSSVEECTYDFGYGDVKEFAAIAQILENTGVMAYLGAAPFIQNSDILAAAGSIVTVEARHAAYLNLLTKADSPFPNAFDPSADKQTVLNAAGQFIVSCP